MAERKPLVPVLVGPTGVGKSAVALALAKYWPITIISADSRQVYRGLDIGTAKPTRAEREAVPHLGLDLIDPGERYSAGRFARDAAGWLAGMPADRRPLIVGGTGFYVQALANGLFREPALDAARREQLRRWGTRLDGMGRWATRLDPAFPGGGRQRAARTVEIALLTGHPLSWWQRQAHDDGIMRPWFVRLTVPRPVLHHRIERRTKAMLEGGWIDEVRAVLAGGVDPAAAGLDGVGYREIVEYLEGTRPRDRLLDTIVTGTRRYAKRQETWFRHQLVGAPVIMLDATDQTDAVARRIAELWQERGD